MDALGLKELLPLIQKMAELQAKLRVALRAHIGTSVDKRIEVQNQIGLHREKLVDFLEGRIGIYGHGYLEKCGQCLGDQELVGAILELDQKIPDRWYALVTSTPEVLAIFGNIFDVYACHKRLTVSEFASVFGDNRSVISGALNVAQEACIALENPRVRDIVRHQLSEGLEEQLGQVYAEREQAAAEFSQVLGQLIGRYGSKTKAAEAIGSSRATVNHVLNGHRSVEFVKPIIAKIKETLAIPESTSVVSAARVSTADATPSHSEGLDPSLLVPDELTQYGGETVDGVPFVLTAESFRGISQLDLLDYIETTKRALARARFLLNIGSQLARPEDRQIIQEKLSRDVEQQGLAVHTFSQAFPNLFVPYMDAQRATWRALRSGEKGEKGK